MRLHDTLTGQDVWKKEYPAESAAVRSFTPEYAAAVSPDGKFEVLAVKTGKSVFAGQIDAANAAAHARDLQKPVLLADGERFYLVLNKGGNPNPNRNYGVVPEVHRRDRGRLLLRPGDRQAAVVHRQAVPRTSNCWWTASPKCRPWWRARRSSPTTAPASTSTRDHRGQG